MGIALHALTLRLEGPLQGGLLRYFAVIGRHVVIKYTANVVVHVPRTNSFDNMQNTSLL